MVDRGSFGAWLSCMVGLALLLATTAPATAQRVQRGAPPRGTTPAARPVSVTGAITAVSATAGTLTITPAGQVSDAAVNLTVTSNTAINVDGKQGQGLANLVVGMRASAAYQASGGVNSALQINASSKARVTGTITAISADGGTVTITPAGQTTSSALTLTTTGSTGISLNGAKGKALANLLPGMEVKADCQLGSNGNTATQILASDKLRTAGTITAVTPASGSTTTGTVTVTSEDGTAVTLNVSLGTGSGTTTVSLDGGNAVTTLASLLPGMHAKAVYQLTSTGNNATHLHVNDKIRLHGTISAVTPSDGSTTTGTVTINPASGAAVVVTVNLGNGTTVTLNGRAVTALSGLSSGSRVEVRYRVTSNGNIVSFLKARSGS